MPRVLLTDGEDARSLLDHVLTYLEASDEANVDLPGIPKKFAKLSVLPATYFDGAIPLGYDEIEDTALRMDDFRPGNAAKPPVWPLDVSWFTPRMGGGETNGLKFCRLRTITPRDLRTLGCGRRQYLSPVMAELSQSWIQDRGHRIDQTLRLSHLHGDWIYSFGGWGVFDELATAMHHDAVNEIAIASHVVLKRRYDWSVVLGFERRTRIRLLTDPTGLREVFKLRDVPDGKTRRAALRNWVSSHWRKKRADPDAAAWVRQHLRGATQFTWGGLTGSIEPAPYEVETLAA